MTRVEENQKVIDNMVKLSDQRPTGTYEEMVTFNLGIISTMLSEISKSLAVLADKADSEE